MAGSRGFVSKKKPPDAARFRQAMPSKPESLSEFQSKLWDELAPALFEAGILDAVNGCLLVSLCCWADIEDKAKKAIDSMEYEDSRGNRQKMLLVKTKRGGPQKNPLEQILRNASNMKHKYMEDLGMTPKTRNRIHLYPRPESNASELKDAEAKLGEIVDGIQSGDIGEELRAQAAEMAKLINGAAKGNEEGRTI